MAGPIVISVLGDTRDLVRSLGQGESRMGRFGRAAGALGKVAAVGLAAGTTAVLAFGGAAVKSASDAQQSLGATETVFGKFADKVVANSDRAAKSVGLSANDYRESANLIGSLFKNQGVAADQLAGKTDEMVRAGADLAATFGGPTSAAVEALGSAFKGEFDPLEKYGISIKQSTINAELAARGQDKLTGAALKAAQQAATSDLIMRQSKDSLGAFGRESNTLAHQQQVLGAQFDNFKAKVGSALLPVLTRLGAYVNDTLFPALDRLGPPARLLAQEVGARVATAFRAVQPALQAAGTTFRDTILPAITRAGSYISTTFGPVLRTLVGIFVGQVLPTVVKFGTFVYGTLYPALVQIGAQIATKLRPVFDQLAVTFQTQVLPAVSVLLAKFEAARPTIQKVILVAAKITGTLLTFAAAILGRVLPPIIRLAGFLLGTFFRAVGVAITVVARIITTVGSFGRKVGEVAGDVGRFASRVGSTISGLPGKITGALGNAKTILLDAGKDIIRGLISGITSMAGDLIRAIEHYVIDKIPGPVRKALGISSPSKVFEGIGRNVVEGLIVGVGKDSRQIETTMSSLARDLATSFDPAEMSVRPALALAGTGLRAGGDTVQITVEVPVGASQVEAGRAVAEALADYYAAGGKRP